MVTKSKMLGLILAGAVIALAAPRAVYADEGAGPNGPWHHDGVWQHHDEEHMMAEVLNLSGTQAKQLKAIKQKQREAKESFFEQIKANGKAIEAEIVKATPDMNKIATIQGQTKALMSQMADTRLNTLLDIKKVLTSEQFAGYMALEKEEHLKKFQMHKGFGPGHGFEKNVHELGKAQTGEKPQPPDEE